jgi:hypothetical protein
MLLRFPGIYVALEILAGLALSNGKECVVEDPGAHSPIVEDMTKGKDAEMMGGDAETCHHASVSPSSGLPLST